MKNAFFTILLFAFSLSSLAQKQDSLPYAITIFEPFKYESRAIPVQNVLNDSTGSYFIYSEGKYGTGSSYLIQFSPDLNRVQGTLTLIDNNQDFNKSTLGIYSDEKFLYHMGYSESRRDISYFLNLVHLDEFKLGEEREIIHLEIDGNAKKSFHSLVRKPGGGYGLIYTLPTSNYEYFQFNTLSFDDKFNETSRYSFEFPENSRKAGFYFGKMMADDEQLMLSFNPSKFNLNFKPDNYDMEYYLLQIRKDSIDTLTKVDNENKWLRQLNSNLDSNIYNLTGIYANEDKYNIRGFFHFKYDLENKKTLAKQFFPLPDSLYKYHMTSSLNLPMKHLPFKQNIKKHKEIPYYFLKDVAQYPDGSQLLVAEQRMVLEKDFSTLFVHGNILLAKFNPDGELEWSQIILKDNTRGRTPIYSGFNLFQVGNKFYIVYTGNSNNLDQQRVTRRQNAFSYTGNQNIILAEVFPDGKIEKKVIIKKSELEGFLPRPGLSSRKGNSLLLFLQDPNNVKNQRFIRLDFKN